MSMSRLVARHLRGLRQLCRILPCVLSRYRSRMPRRVNIELTHRCNLQCEMCWLHGDAGGSNRYRDPELTTGQVFRLLDEIAAWAPRVYLGGGEPFMRDDIVTIIDRIKSRNMHVSFTTNGTLIGKDTVRQLVALEVDCINVSVHLDDDPSDSSSRSETLERVKSFIAELDDQKKGCASGVPRLTANIVLTAKTVDRLQAKVRAFIDLVEDRVDVYRLHHLWYATDAEFAAHQAVLMDRLGCTGCGAASHVLPPQFLPDPRAVARELTAFTRVPKITSFPNLDAAEINPYYSEFPALDGRCIAPLSSVVIKPNGDVVFCPDDWICDYVIGNVKSSRLAEMWNGTKAREFRSVLFREGRFPICKRCSWMHSFT